MKTLNDYYSDFVANPSEETKDALWRDVVSYVTKLAKQKSRRSASSFCNQEEAIGDTLADAFRDFSKFDASKASFSTWITSIANHKFADTLNAHKVRGYTMLIPEQHPYNPHLGVEAKLTVKKLISQLDAEDQKFVKAKMEGLSETELGQEFGKDEMWAKNKWKRLVPKLKEML